MRREADGSPGRAFSHLNGLSSSEQTSLLAYYPEACRPPGPLTDGGLLVECPSHANPGPLTEAAPDSPRAGSGAIRGAYDDYRESPAPT